MTLDQQIRTFWKTQAFTASMELKAAGWDEKVLDVEQSTGPRMFLYVHDVITQWSWMCLLPLDSFQKVSLDGCREPALTQDVRDTTAALISNVADGKPPAAIDGLDWEHHLGWLIAMYAGTTKTWELAERFRASGHFIVLNYRKEGSEGGMLRPLAVPRSTTVLAAEHFKKLVKKVIAADRDQHPEWFA